MKGKWTCIALAAAILFAGCAEIPIKKATRMKTDDLVVIGDFIADQLTAGAGERLAPAKPVLVASFVDVNDVEKASNFGRMVSEYIISRLSEIGYTSVEAKPRESVYAAKGRGSLALSDAFMEMAQSNEAAAVVVGTYLTGKTDVFVSARLVELESGRVISATGFSLPFTDRLKNLFW